MHITEAVRDARIAPSRSRENVFTKLVILSDSGRTKIKVTPALRSCVFEPQARPVSPSIENEFGSAGMRIVGFPDLYVESSPRFTVSIRALFDVREGVDEALIWAFFVYLVELFRMLAFSCCTIFWPGPAALLCAISA